MRRYIEVGGCKFKPVQTGVESAWCLRLKLKCEEQLSNFAFKFKLRLSKKWPTWLHKQTEKQRIIWAYKLLFLVGLSLHITLFVNVKMSPHCIP